MTPPTPAPTDPRRRDDAQLLRAVAAGDEPAFVELRGRYRRFVYRICRGLMRQHAAEDCAQEVFTRVWLKAGHYDEARGTAAAWLATITRNVARGLLAKRVPEPTDAEPALEAVVDPAVERLWVRSALARLPDHERRVLELAYDRGLSQSEIAAAMGVPLGTVKTWTRRGLCRLAALLEGGETA